MAMRVKAKIRLTQHQLEHLMDELHKQEAGEQPVDTILTFNSSTMRRGVEVDIIVDVYVGEST